MSSTLKLLVCVIALAGIAVAQAPATGNKDIDRKPLHTRVQDPGTAILQLNVRDLDGLLKTLKAGGYPAISPDGQPVTIGGARFAMVRDPNNLYLELIQRAP